MGRRTSGQTVGYEKIGLVQANQNTLTTTQDNADLNFDPNGTGDIVAEANVHITDQQALRLMESSSNGSNYIGMKASATMSSNYTITFPSAVSASTGFVLTSDASGNLTWASAGGNIPVADSGSTATIHYPLFGTNAGALPSTLTPLVRSSLTFVPSTGELFSTLGRHPNIIGTATASGTLTLRGTSDATKAAASVLMSDNVASSSTTSGTLVVTGGVGISGQLTATTLVETSSIAFKENINPIENALDVVMQLFGVTYDRKDNNEHEAGLIAEHVYAIAPDLVSLDKNGNPYGIKYTKIGAYLIEAIKTLKQEINELKR